MRCDDKKEKKLMAVQVNIMSVVTLGVGLLPRV